MTASSLPAGPEMEAACVAAAVAFNRKAVAKLLPFRIKTEEDHECMMAAISAALKALRPSATNKMEG